MWLHGQYCVLEDSTLKPSVILASADRLLQCLMVWGKNRYLNMLWQDGWVNWWSSGCSLSWMYSGIASKLFPVRHLCQLTSRTFSRLDYSVGHYVVSASGSHSLSWHGVTDKVGCSMLHHLQHRVVCDVGWRGLNLLRYISLWCTCTLCSGHKPLNLLLHDYTMISI